MGNGNNVLSWFQSYFTDRKQLVSVGTGNSTLQRVLIGVPQDSILAPKLFTLYINDMSESCNIHGFTHFADDTTVHLSNPDLNILQIQINHEHI